MHAIILAGGEGTRLRPLTNDRPKPMVEIDNRPMLEHQIRQLRKAGITNITLLECYLSEVIQNYFGDGKKFGVNIHHMVLPKELESAGVIKKALEHIPEKEKNVLVLYGDIISDIDFLSLTKKHVENDSLLTAVTIPAKSPYGEWDVDDSGRTLSFQEKPIRQTNSGIFVVNRGIQDFLSEGKGFFDGVVTPLASQGSSVVQTFKHEGFWRDIADVKNLKEAEQAKEIWMVKDSELYPNTGIESVN